MSLLMDALRRAEQDKKLQEMRASGVASATGTASPPPIDADAATMEAPLVAAEDITLPPPAQRPGTVAAHLTPAPAGASHGDAASAPAELALEPLDQAGAGPASAPVETAAASASGQRLDREQTGTMPSARARESDLNAYFDPSRSFEMPIQRAVPEHTLEDLASHTVVDAQTVFAAGQRPRASRLLLAVALLAVVVVTGIGVVAILYAQRSPGPHHIPPPTVAEGVERPPLRELPLVPQDEPAQPASDHLPRLDTVTATAQPDPPVVSAPPASVAEPEAAPAVTTLAAPAAPAPPAPTPPPAAPAPTPAAASPAAPPVAVAAPIRDVGVGEVRIARAHRPAAPDADLTTAYEAFQAGKLDAAEVRYRAALSAQPGRRDALLGLGAIAIARGDHGAAYRHYAEVLERNPDDAVARAALFSLTGADGEAGAARLRLLQDAHPDAAYLRFALGNWYARQGRWADAQQAYFEAHNRDAANPDYVYNLAISLDRMGQAKAALEYYQKALALADRGAVGFNPTPVLERIRDLGAAALQ